MSTTFSDATQISADKTMIHLEGVDKFFGDFQALKNINLRVGWPDLKTELRPALLRIGERIAQLLIALPKDLDPVQVTEATRHEIRSVQISEASRVAIADAITALTSAPSLAD